MSLSLIIIAIVLAVASGLPGLCLRRTSAWGQRIATGIMLSSTIIGLAGTWLGLGFHQSRNLIFPWPAMGNSLVGMDALSAFFLVPIFLMSGLGSLYGNGYWPQIRHRRNGRKLRLFWGFLTAGLALLVISKHAMAFLFGWEVMALSAFFLVSTEDHRKECQRAGWIYFIATHICTLTLFVLFALWRWATGSFDLKPVASDAMGMGMMNVLFFLSLLGFGMKAGIMPFHFWLPDSHANAPTHVSAMLSGVVIKMGIYGLVRFLSLLPNPPRVWGGLLLLLGAISGLLGVAFAISQHDLKRLLAYHSVENIGIILMGLGLAMLGYSTNRPEWVVLGLAGCLLHTWNHGLFKSLLFLSAGSVIHSVHTRQIDLLGGLAKTMPWTAALFLVGSVAICGLPPLNGFVSELFIYLGLFQTMTINEASGSAAIIAVPVLAMIGSLAIACFVKVFSTIFLGNPRTHAAEHPHESPLLMRSPMVVLAFCCVMIGLVPVLVSPLLDRVIAVWRPELDLTRLSLTAIAPLKEVTIMSISLVGGIFLLMIALVHPSRITNRVGTWDCGYARPTNRMQYTSSSFARMIVAMFHWALHPRIHLPKINGLFPKPEKMHSHVDDIVLDRGLRPMGHRIERVFGWFHQFQQGLTQHYVLYILITVIVILSTRIPFREFLARLFAR